MSQLAKFGRHWKTISVGLVRYSSGNAPTTGGSDQGGDNAEQTDADGIPPMPTNCCMSGCANCVWIEYADKLSEKLLDGSQQVREIIMKEIQDPNMRAYLDMELRNLERSKEK